MTLQELNLAVALLEGWELDPYRPAEEYQIRKLIYQDKYEYALVGKDYSPATNWNQGGPIIERQGIHIKKSYGEFVVPVMEYGNFISCSYITSSFLETGMRYYVDNPLAQD